MGQTDICGSTLKTNQKDVNEHLYGHCRSDEDVDVSGEDVIRVCASEKIEMKPMDCNVPYKRIRVSNIWILLCNTSSTKHLPGF